MTYFYHQTIRKITTGFGRIFNNVYVRNQDATNSSLNYTQIKVPLSYAPKETFLRRANEDPLIAGTVRKKLTLPRMSFELTNMSYDSTRKQNSTSRRSTPLAGDANRMKYRYERVPWNFDYQLNILTRNVEQGLQIIEQVLPGFCPEQVIAINAIETIDEKVDIPIVFNGFAASDSYEDPIEDNKRILTWTLNFTAKGWIYPNVTDSDVIRTVISTIKDSKSLGTVETITVTPNPSNAVVGDEFGIDVEIV